ncbi:MAG: YggS family pyridoxal phosphate-dependent enzyme [Treponema sp.]|nr:YggS family pyridoxal phosphate-dependent enzyme [Treponema sp.]
MTALDVAHNVETVRSLVEAAVLRSGRKPGAVALCAVSKFHSAQSVLSAMDAGLLLFGENRVQEAAAKFSAVNSVCRESGRPVPCLHIIGSLQRNKAKKAVGCAGCIQSVDRLELLSDIEKHAAASLRQIEVFLEIHTGEESKAGFKDEKSLHETLDLAASGAFPHVEVRGLMTMAPFTGDQSAVHASFSSLRRLRERLNAEYPTLPISELSMGMSGDFEAAIEEGSTMVRIGTAIFGEREAGVVHGDGK